MCLETIFYTEKGGAQRPRGTFFAMVSGTSDKHKCCYTSTVIGIAFPERTDCGRDLGLSGPEWGYAFVGGTTFGQEYESS